MGTLRMLLALAVAISHASGVFGYKMVGGTFAVQAFYIISGFLISHILLAKYEATPRGNWLFYSNRALRIFVPYWTVLIATAIAALILHAVWGRSFGAFATFGFFETTPGTKAFLAFTNLFIIGQDLALWLKLSGGALRFAWDALRESQTERPPVASFFVLAPAWALALELMFYATAPFLLRRRTATLIAIVAVSLAARVITYKAGYATSATLYRFFPFEIALFLAGAISYRLYQVLARQGIVNLGTSLVATAVMIPFVVFYAKIPYLSYSPWFWAFYLLVALTLPFLFDFSRRVKADRWLGELSYPIYLIHWPVEQIGFHFFPALPPSGWLNISLIAITLALSVALVLLVSAPLDRWRERRVPTSSGDRASDKGEPDYLRKRAAGAVANVNRG